MLTNNKPLLTNIIAIYGPNSAWSDFYLDIDDFYTIPGFESLVYDTIIDYTNPSVKYAYIYIRIINPSHVEEEILLKTLAPFNLQLARDSGIPCSVKIEALPNLDKYENLTIGTVIQCSLMKKDDHGIVLNKFIITKIPKELEKFLPTRTNQILREFSEIIVKDYF